MAAKPPAEFKSLAWVGSAKRDLLALPEEVIDTFGYALHLAQAGRKHAKAKRGIAPPRQDMELIRVRLRVAEQMAKELPR